MRMRRSARLGGVVFTALGLSVTFVPPAQAEGVKELVFQGDAALSGGLSYPCMTTTTVTVQDPTSVTKGTKTCPPEVSVDTTPTKKEQPLRVNGNTRTGAFGSDVCVGTSAMVKPEKPGPTAGECTILASFFVTGYCGLSQGRGTGTATITDEVTGYVNRFSFKFTWTDPGTQTLLILGNWWFGHVVEPPPSGIDGDIVGAAMATPVPLDSPPNSCVDKTAQDFRIQGEVTLTHPKCLPGHNTSTTPCTV